MKNTKIGKDCYIDSRVSTSGDCEIGNNVTLRYDTIIARGCKIGDNTYVCPRVMTNNLDTEKIQIGGAHTGKNCFLGTNTVLQHGISIGNNCTIHPYCVLYGLGGLKIGNWVRMAAHTVIIPANHIYKNPDIPISKQGLTMEGVEIKDDVWIGANAVIRTGIIIGKGSIIGANAVVLEDVPSLSIVVGNPGRVIKNRFPDQMKADKYMTIDFTNNPDQIHLKLKKIQEG